MVKSTAPVSDEISAFKPKTGNIFGSELKCLVPNVTEKSQVKFTAVVDVQEYEQSEYNLDSSSNKYYQEQRLKVFEIVEKHYATELNSLKSFVHGEIMELRKKSTELKYPFTIHPSASYFLQQYLLCCTELLLRLEKRKISYRNFREFAGNLASLYEIMVKRASANEEYNSVSMLISLTLSKLLESWDVIAMVLEDVHQKQMTDWIEVATVTRNVFPQMGKNATIRAVTVPPPNLSVLNTPYFIGSCCFGNQFFTQLGRIPLVVKTAPIKPDPNAAKKNQVRLLAQACCQLRHALVERVLATLAINDHYLVYTDTIFGITVQQMIKKIFYKQGCPLEVTRVIIAQIGLAIFYLHLNGFIHLDVTAVNVLVSSTCRVKLIGLESAKQCIGLHNIHRKREFFRRTSRELVGKENYPDNFFCPPEILKNFPIGRSVDWWYLGALAFYMYYNKKPFQGKSEAETGQLILKGRLRMKKTSAKGFKHFKSFIHDSLNPKAKSRLCSKTYAQFLKHRFFHGMLWEVMEQSSAFIELFEVEGQMEAHDDYWVPPKMENTTQKNVANVFNFGEDYEICKPACVSYSSRTMRSTFEKLNRDPNSEEFVWEEGPSSQLPLKDIRAKDSPYKFRKFFKTTRVPREMEKPH